MKKYYVFRSIILCLFLSLVFQSFGQEDYSQYLTSFSETNPPTGEIRFPAEFEPVQAVVVAHYQTGRNLPVRLIKEMAEDCKVITLVNSAKWFTTQEVKDLYSSAGVNVDNCEFIEVPLSGRWTRDYAPWFIFDDGKPAIVDNIYDRVFPGSGNNNPSQTNDDAISAKFAEYYDIPLYGMKIVHTGGNMMQDGRGIAVSDSIVITESAKYVGVDAEDVHQKMKDYLGIETYHVTVDPQGDYIAHVDCWGKFLAPDKILLARVEATHAQYEKYESVAKYFENTNCCWGYPYQVYRVDVPTRSGNKNIASPYTNSLILNNKVFVPLDADTDDYYNNAALAVYEEAMPGYEIIGIEYNYDSESGDWDGWYNTDALHCRTREIMDFNMLFVDHREVLHGDVAQKNSYPITAKFIAYSGDAITSTQLHYSINDGDWQTVNMTVQGTSGEYKASITGCNVGDNVKYYLTGEDASGRTCAQPYFAELEPHSFTVVENTGSEPEPEPTPEPGSITLTANTTTITANGTDAVTFTVMQGTNDVTSQCVFYQVVGTGSQIAANPFTTITAGNYDFYATYGSGTEALTSNTIRIEAIDATEPEEPEDITIAFSKDTFVADGEDFITVTIWQGTTDVTSECDIYYEYNSKHTQYTEDKFTTTNAGTYTFYANKGELWSDNYPIVATEPEGSDEPEQPGEGEKETKEISGNNINEVGANGSDIYRIPISTYNRRSLSQHYYTQSEIDKNSGNITQIAFKLLSVLNGRYNTETTINEAISRNIEIYMRNDDASSFGTSTTTIKFEENDKVYEGTINLGLTKGWVTIDLNVPFKYEGSNILICINDTTCEWTDYKLLFEAFSADSRTLFISGDETTPYDVVNKTISNNVKSYNVVPSIQFTFVAEEPVEPTTPTYTGDGAWDVTENWNVFPEEEDDVIIDGNVVIPAGYTAIANSIDIKSGSITIEDGGQLIHSNSGVTATVKKDIAGYNTREEIASRGWHTISSPIANSIDVNHVTDLLSNDYDLYYYDEPTHYWINHKDVNSFSTLDAGRGYLYANSNDITLEFTGIINHNDVNFALNCQSDRLTGFNLVGNPFSHNIYKGKNAAIDSDNLSEGYYSLSNEGQ
ncbi:MAG: agmatine deiminase family protein [Lentimicrobiaceae bacterium]|nr:agmatine deiminase family protein [Lentimicrobiaceae bacterium]